MGKISKSDAKLPVDESIDSAWFADLPKERRAREMFFEEANFRSISLNHLAKWGPRVLGGSYFVAIPDLLLCANLYNEPPDPGEGDRGGRRPKTIESGLSPTAILLALNLVSNWHTDKNNNAAVGTTLLAMRTGLSQRQVQRGVKELTGQFWVQQTIKQYRRHRGQAATLHVNFDMSPTVSALKQMSNRLRSELDAGARPPLLRRAGLPPDLDLSSVLKSARKTSRAKKILKDNEEKRIARSQITKWGRDIFTNWHFVVVPDLLLNLNQFYPKLSGKEKAEKAEIDALIDADIAALDEAIERARAEGRDRIDDGNGETLFLSDLDEGNAHVDVPEMGRLSPTTHLVLIHLISHWQSNADPIVFPTLIGLERRMGVGRRQIQRALSELVKMRWIKRVKQQSVDEAEQTTETHYGYDLSPVPNALAILVDLWERERNISAFAAWKLEEALEQDRIPAGD